MQEVKWRSINKLQLKEHNGLRHCVENRTRTISLYTLMMQFIEISYN